MKTHPLYHYALLKENFDSPVPQRFRLLRIMRLRRGGRKLGPLNKVLALVRLGLDFWAAAQVRRRQGSVRNGHQEELHKQKINYSCNSNNNTRTLKIGRENRFMYAAFRLSSVLMAPGWQELQNTLVTPRSWRTLLSWLVKRIFANFVCP